MLGSKYNHSTFLEILVAKNTWSGAQDQISSLANDQMTSRGMADLKTWKKVSIEVTLLKIASLLNKKKKKIKNNAAAEVSEEGEGVIH